jgi:predicted transcriptional regulator
MGKKNINIHRFIREFMVETEEASTREIYKYFDERKPGIAMTMTRLGSLLHSNKWVEINHRGKCSDTTTWKIKKITGEDNY